VGRADVLICATDSDEKNLLAGLISMEIGVRKVISRYTMREYEAVFDYTGIKIAVGFHIVVSNEITKTMFADEQSILKMKREGELFFSVSVKGKISGMRVGEVDLPEGVRITCIIRGDLKIYPAAGTVFEEGDKVLLYTYEANPSKVERIFSK
jgi:trk system potassium uptake protein TrkA